jgi:uncharacterized Zn finger protein
MEKITLTTYCEDCKLIHDENNCQEDIEKALEFVENNPIELTEQEAENFILRNEDAVYQIANKEGYLEGVLDDEMPDKIDQFITESDLSDLVEKIRAYQESQ